MSSPKKIDLLGIAILFARKKIPFISIVVLVTVIGTILAFVSPKSYKSSFSYIVSSSSPLGGITALSFINTEMSSDHIIFVLRSNILIDELIKGV